MAIISFRHKGLKNFYETGNHKAIMAAHVTKLSRILALLDVISSPADINLSSYRLHELSGNLKGFWSIKVNGNWRVTFRFIGTDVELVDYQDYH